MAFEYVSVTLKALLSQVQVEKASFNVQQEKLKFGYLQKRGYYMKTWKTRWFVLYKDTLAYSANPDSPTIRGIPLSKISVDVLDNDELTKSNNQSAFILKTQHREYQCLASSKQERDEWIEAIQKAKEGSVSEASEANGKGGFQPSNFTLSDLQNIKDFFHIKESVRCIGDWRCSMIMPKSKDFVAGILTTFDDCLCFFERVPTSSIPREGYMQKQSDARNGHWSTYYFVLDDLTLSFYDNPQAKEAYVTKGNIPLLDIHSVVPTTEEETHKKNSFQILTSSKKYHFACGTEAITQEWINAIKSKVATCILQRNLTAFIPLKYCADLQQVNSAVFPSTVVVKLSNNEEFMFVALPDHHRVYQSITTYWNSLPKERASKDWSSYLGPGFEPRIENPELPLDVELIDRVRDPESAETRAFLKIFSLPDTENLIEVHSCEMKRRIIMIGKMYISENYVCFHADTLFVHRAIMIPHRDVKSVEEVSFFREFLWKAICIKANNQQFVFGGLTHRTEVVNRLRQCAKLAQARAHRKAAVDSDHFHSEGEFMLESVKHLRIKILVIGSRGDVQPFIALALGLQKYGHSVTIATHETHRQFVTEWGLEFFPLAGDPKELMALCVNNDMFSYGFIKEGLENFGNFVENLLVSTWEACKENTDVIIQNPPAMGGIHVAERLDVPLFVAFTMPWSRTTKFPHPFAVPAVPMGELYNYSSYVAVEHGMWLPMRGKFNHFRKDVLGLPTVDFMHSGHSLLHDKKVPFLYCWSPSVLPKPSDWENHIGVTGYWFLDSPVTWKPPEDLVKFIEGETKPIYIGFGSVTVEDPDKLTDIIVKAVAKANCKAVLVKGWGGLASVEYPPNIFALDSVPHDWLFPKMAAVIHHGGAGTTAAGLRAGVPTLIVPFFGDQYFWGTRVAEMGVGVPYITVPQLTVNKLSNAITKLITDKEIQANAATLGEHIRSQNGVAKAIEFLHRQIFVKERKKSTSQT